MFKLLTILKQASRRKRIRKGTIFFTFLAIERLEEAFFMQPSPMSWIRLFFLHIRNNSLMQNLSLAEPFRGILRQAQDDFSDQTRDDVRTQSDNGSRLC